MKPAQRRDCKQCGRPIIICEDQSGATQALDAEAKCYDLEKDPDSGEEFALRSAASYVTHFASCPAAMDQAARGEGFVDGAR